MNYIKRTLISVLLMAVVALVVAAAVYAPGAHAETQVDRCVGTLYNSGA